MLLRTKATSACHRACRANDISQSLEFQFGGATRPDRSAVNSGTRNAERMRLLKGVPRHSKTTEDTLAMLSACEPARARPPRQPASLVLRPPALAPWGSPPARARGAERGHGATGAAACSPARCRATPATSGSPQAGSHGRSRGHDSQGPFAPPFARGGGAGAGGAVRGGARPVTQSQL